MTVPAHIVAAADQEEAELQRTLRSLIDAYSTTFTGTEETKVATTFMALKMVYPTHGDMACAAAELVRMVVNAERAAQS